MASPSPSTVSTVSAAGSSSTPTSTSTITPATYAASTSTPTAHVRPYPLSASQPHPASSIAHNSTPPDMGGFGGAGFGGTDSLDGTAGGKSRIPVTPAVLRAIFASSRSPGEERGLSRVAFFRFSGFLLSCLAISLLANQGRIRSGAALLGVGV
ncbi:hypothetical protein BV25DRAFT_1821602 [Artomyces pyxidatus]|uniref:Uncharacterized protein n=1 Tax=Artomyces pyxidatus TaxID=48021 RepID=A0ACB8TBE6_9AGAM|nr:hypothetical protein BV25DRAFT_1821602 [Artomyces pyxidatus]